MKKIDVTWRIFGMYILLIILMLFGGSALGQVNVKYFNAEWNDANSVDWCHTDKKGLKDCKVVSYDIGEDKESQKKYKIAVIPTIIIFKDGEEVARFQADLSFKMVATREEVQDEIDNQLMSDF
jgi:thiol-disulfide isomerase/thioredoxin